MQQFKITFLLFFILLSIVTSGQRLVYKFDPNLQNYFQFSHPLNDSILRICSTSNETSGWGYSKSFVSDWNVKLNTVETWYPVDSTFGDPLIWSGVQLLSLPFPNGDNIIVVNSFDCDIGPPYDILYLEKNRIVKWFVRGYDIDPYPFNAIEIGLVAKDVIALRSEISETTYFTMDGLQMTYDQKPIMYTHIFYHKQYIYGLFQNHWVQFDSSFQVNNYYFLDTVLNVIGLGENYLLQSGTKLLLMNDHLQVIAQSNDFHMVHAACWVGPDIGIIDGNTFFLLDSNLEIIHSYPYLPQESMNAIQANHDTVYIFSTYNGIHHSDFIIREYGPGSVSTVPVLDMLLKEIQLPDTVYVDFPDGNFWFIQMNFDTVFLEIWNNGNDTIRNCRVECDWIGDTQCSDYQRSWVIDQLSIPPGEVEVIKLNPFKTDTLPYAFHSPFCFWVESPNGQPDPNPSNNYSCASTKLAVAVDDIKGNEWVSITPNPADDGIFITFDQGVVGKMTLNLLSLDGKLVYQSNIHPGSEFVSLRNYSPGIYLVHLIMENGKSWTQELVIQH